MPYHAPSQAISKPPSIPLFTKPHVEENTLPDVKSQGFSLSKEKLIPPIPLSLPLDPSTQAMETLIITILHKNSSPWSRGSSSIPRNLKRRKSHSLAVLPALQTVIPQLALYRNFEWTPFHHHLPPLQREDTPWSATHAEGRPSVRLNSAAPTRAAKAFPPSHLPPYASPSIFRLQSCASHDCTPPDASSRTKTTLGDAELDPEFPTCPCTLLGCQHALGGALFLQHTGSCQTRMHATAAHGGRQSCVSFRAHASCSRGSGT